MWRGRCHAFSKYRADHLRYIIFGSVNCRMQQMSKPVWVLSAMILGIGLGSAWLAQQWAEEREHAVALQVRITELETQLARSAEAQERSGTGEVQNPASAAPATHDAVDAPDHDWPPSGPLSEEIIAADRAYSEQERALYEDPEFREASLKETTARFRQRFAALRSELGLPPEEFERVVEALAKAELQQRIYENDEKIARTPATYESFDLASSRWHAERWRAIDLTLRGRARRRPLPAVDRIPAQPSGARAANRAAGYARILRLTADIRAATGIDADTARGGRAQRRAARGAGNRSRAARSYHRHGWKAAPSGDDDRNQGRSQPVNHRSGCGDPDAGPARGVSRESRAGTGTAAGAAADRASDAGGFQRAVIARSVLRRQPQDQRAFRLRVAGREVVFALQGVV